MKKQRYLFALALALAALGGVQAFALDYTITGPEGSGYYKSTNYEDVYGSAYNYGGANVVDYAVQPELPGYISSVQVQQPMVTTGTSTPSYDSTTLPDVWDGWTVPSLPQTAFTSSAGLARSDGSIGTLKIPSLGINVKAFEGETTSSMRKGVGHFTSTSAWNGNVGLCGHNRGATYVIGAIKNLTIGDTITYSTTLGTRTYRVSFVGKIANDDWSYLGPTADNRITLFTCVENQPSLRWCVQAIEKA